VKEIRIKNGISKEERLKIPLCSKQRIRKPASMCSMRSSCFSYSSSSARLRAVLAKATILCLSEAPSSPDLLPVPTALLARNNLGVSDFFPAC
jgi:hypothetical protein